MIPTAYRPRPSTSARPAREQTSELSHLPQYTRPFLLLLIGESPAHGYDLGKRLGQLGLGDVDRGHLYKTLRTLDSEGLLESSWQASSSGPARRTYRLTPLGLAQLDAQSAAIREGHRHVSSYLDRFDALSIESRS